MQAIPKTKKITVKKKYSTPKAEKINKNAKTIEIKTFILIALNISSGEILPVCIARSGPILSLLSVPLTPSP